MTNTTISVSRIGYDLRRHCIPIEIPNDCVSVGYDDAGRREIIGQTRQNADNRT